MENVEEKQRKQRLMKGEDEQKTRETFYGEEK